MVKKQKKSNKKRAFLILVCITLGLFLIWTGAYQWKLHQERERALELKSDMQNLLVELNDTIPEWKYVEECYADRAKGASPDKPSFCELKLNSQTNDKLSINKISEIINQTGDFQTDGTNKFYTSGYDNTGYKMESQSFQSKSLPAANCDAVKNIDEQEVYIYCNFPVKEFYFTRVR